MANTNVLEGIACPVCGFQERFDIEATSMFAFTDDGAEDFGDVEFSEASEIQCGQCGHYGYVKEFEAGP